MFLLLFIDMRNKNSCLEVNKLLEVMHDAFQA
jgi:hypothetical protein